MRRTGRRSQQVCHELQVRTFASFTGTIAADLVIPPDERICAVVWTSVSPHSAVRRKWTSSSPRASTGRSAWKIPCARLSRCCTRASSTTSASRNAVRTHYAVDMLYALALLSDCAVLLTDTHRSIPSRSSRSKLARWYTRKRLREV